MVNKVDYAVFAGYDAGKMKAELEAFEKMSIAEQRVYFKLSWYEAIKAQTKDFTNLIKLFDSLLQREKILFFEELGNKNVEFYRQFLLARKASQLSDNLPKDSVHSTTLTDRQIETQKILVIPVWFKEEMHELFPGVAIDYQEIEQFCKKLAKDYKEESFIDHLKQKIEELKKEGKYQLAFVLLEFLPYWAGSSSFPLKDIRWIIFQNQNIKEEFNETIDKLKKDIWTRMREQAESCLKEGNIDQAIAFGKMLPNVQFFYGHRFSFLLKLAKACVPNQIEKLQHALKEVEACIGPGTEENLRMMRREMAREVSEIALSLAKFEDTHLLLVYHCISQVREFIEFNELVRIFDQFSKLSTFEALMKLHLDQKTANIMKALAQSICNKDDPTFREFFIKTFPNLDESQLVKAVGGIISHYCKKSRFSEARAFLKHLEKYPEWHSEYNKLILREEKYKFEAMRKAATKFLATLPRILSENDHKIS